MSAPASTLYALRAPCRNCPFRSNIEPYLREDRAREIAASLRAGGGFTCHKTTVPDESDESGGSARPGPRAMECAGALATMERENAPNQMMRISERLGMYDPEPLRSSTHPVFPSLTDWVRAHGSTPTVEVEGETLEYEHCGVVGPDCEDPAGFGGFGGVYVNDEEPTCHPIDCCENCGHAMCTACRADIEDEKCCIYCSEDATGR